MINKLAKILWICVVVVPVLLLPLSVQATEAIGDEVEERNEERRLRPLRRLINLSSGEGDLNWDVSFGDWGESSGSLQSAQGRWHRWSYLPGESELNWDIALGDWLESSGNLQSDASRWHRWSLYSPGESDVTWRISLGDWIDSAGTRQQRWCWWSCRD